MIYLRVRRHCEKHWDTYTHAQKYTHTHIYIHTYRYTRIHARKHACRHTYNKYMSTSTHKVREKTREKGYFGIINENGTFSIGRTFFFQAATFPSCFLLLKQSIMIDRKRIIILGKDVIFPQHRHHHHHHHHQHHHHDDLPSLLFHPPPFPPLSPGVFPAARILRAIFFKTNATYLEHRTKFFNGD